MVLEIILDVSKKLSGYFTFFFYVMVGISVILGRSLLYYIDPPENPLLPGGQGKSVLKILKKYIRMFFYVRRLDPMGYDEEAIKRGNEYIDKLLKDMFNDRDGIDPYVLEDSAVGFQKKVLFVNVTGEAKLYDGSIVGLSTLHREHHCSLDDMGKNIKVRANLAAGDLEFYYKGSVKFMNFGPTVSVEGSLAFIEVEMEFLVDRDTGKNGRLTKFVIDDMKGMQVKVSGLGPLNWALNPIVNGVTKIFKKFVRNFMENKVEAHLKERIPNYQFPVEGGEETESPETTPTPETEAPKTTPTPGTEAPETTPTPGTEAPETTPTPGTEAPETTPTPGTEAPETTPTPGTEAPETTPTPGTEAPETTATPGTEAPETTATPGTEAPETTATPGTEAPETTATPGTEAPETTATPETEAPKPTETEAPPEETEAPPEETEAPPEETEAPPEETEAPPEETEAPPEETEAPPEETEAPPEETESHQKQKTLEEI